MIAMTTPNQHTSKRRRGFLAIFAAGAVAVAIAVAGCGGSSSTAASPGYMAPAQHAKPASGIPQGNGGDHDADNNGGPSDGDGNI